MPTLAIFQLYCGMIPWNFTYEQRKELTMSLYLTCLMSYTV